MNRDFGLLDAALGRAREGLRVLGEIARFALGDAAAFVALKELRHRLVAVERAFGSGDLLAARSGLDAGGGLGAVFSNERQSWYDIIRANSNRTGESLRLLQELAPAYAPGAISALEELRYELYQAELRLAGRTPHFWLARYFNQGVVYPLSDSVEALQHFITRGARVVQLRDKNSSEAALFNKAQALCRWLSRWHATRAERALFILNDNVALAAKLPVAGVHLGQSDGAIALARRRLGLNKIIGRSNHSLADMRRAAAEGADYVSLGPVFATPNKPEREALGLELVAAAAKEITIPWVVIGGINRAEAGAVYGAGAKNLAVIRGAKEWFG